MSIFLILLAAGDSKRLKSSCPKPYQLVNNKTILQHSLNAFDGIKEIKKTLVVYNKKHKKYINKINLKNTLKIIGGKSRQESTYIALRKISRMKCQKVLIHDSARPNPPIKMIKNIIFLLKKNDAIIPIIKVNDAAKRFQNNIVFKNIKRNTLGLSQTPQGFNFKKIYKKHSNNINSSFDDDASLFTIDDEKVITIKGAKTNLKITDKEDLKIFKTYKNKKQYFGIGFDVHRLAPKRKLYLGGLYIKSKLGTLGHSDGDPVLHSIIPQTGARDYGVLAWNLIIGSSVPGFPSRAPKIPHAIFVTGPQPNSQFRIPEIYDLTECCCGPRQDQNSMALKTFLHMQPFVGQRKSCCGPHEDQNLDVLNIMSTFVTFKII